MKWQAVIQWCFAMAEDRISIHEIRLILAFKEDPDRWYTNSELTAMARISPRTARAHTARLSELGVLDVEKVFPANKYRLKEHPGEEAENYWIRWEKARKVFNL